MNYRILTLLFVLTTLISSCKKTCNDPNSINFDKEGACLYADSSQRNLVLKVTAAWCKPCGSYGIRQMNSLLRRNASLIGLAIHRQDVMSSDVGDEFIKYARNTSVPSFYFDGKSRTLPQNQNTTAKVGLYLDWSKEGNELSVTTAIQTRAALEGTYNLAVYLVEDGHVAAQKASDHTARPDLEYNNGTYPAFEHNHVLRGEATGKMFGEQIISDGLSSGEVMNFDKKLTINEKITGTVYPVVAVWKKEGASYVLENVISGKE